MDTKWGVFSLLLLCFAPVIPSTFGDDLGFPYIDENDKDLTNDQTRTVLAAKTADNNMGNQEKSTKDEFKKSKLTRARDFFRQSFKSVAAQMKVKDESSLGSKIGKMQWNKLADGIGKLNDVFYKLNNTKNERLMLQGLCELVGVTVQWIPGPLGIALYGVAMIGAVIFGSQSPTTMRATATVVRSELLTQYLKELGDEVMEEAELIDLLTNQFRTAEEREFNTSKPCLERQPEQFQNGTHMSAEEHTRRCNQNAVTKENKDMLINLMTDVAKAGMPKVAKVRNAIAWASEERLKSMGDLIEIHKLLSMAAKLTSLRFAMFEQVNSYTSVYMPGATQVYDAELKERVREQNRFRVWIESTVGGTAVPTQSVLALYLLRNPVVGMETITDVLVEKMEDIFRDVEGKDGDHKFKMLGSTDGQNFKILGTFRNFWSTRLIGQCRRYECTPTSPMDAPSCKWKDKCEDKSDVLDLQKYNSTDLTQGFVIRRFFDKSQIWGLDGGGVTPQEESQGLSAFAFHPVARDGVPIHWVMMVTHIKGKRNDHFSLVYTTTADMYLFAEKGDFSWFKDMSAHFYKFQAY